MFIETNLPKSLFVQLRCALYLYLLCYVTIWLHMPILWDIMVTNYAVNAKKTKFNVHKQNVDIEQLHIKLPAWIRNKACSCLEISRCYN